MDFKQLGHEIKGLDTSKGVIEAYANVYNNIDSDGDRSIPGCFTKTVKDNFKRIRVLRNHWSNESLGVPKELNASDPYGLFTVTQFNMNKSLAKDMFTDIQLAVDNNQNAELSIGYEIVNSEQTKLNGMAVRDITEYRLYEYSFLNSWAANPLAITTGVKSLSPSAIIEQLTKAYNLPYSDQRLIQIETILKSLTLEPGRDTTLIDEPTKTDLLNHIKNSFN